MKNLDISFEVAKLDLIANESGLFEIIPTDSTEKLIEGIEAIEAQLKTLGRHEKIEVLGLWVKVKNAKGRLSHIKAIAKKIIDKGTEPLLRHHHTPGQNAVKAGRPIRGHILSVRSGPMRDGTRNMTPQNVYANRAKWNRSGQNNDASGGEKKSRGCP